MKKAVVVILALWMGMLHGCAASGTAQAAAPKIRRDLFETVGYLPDYRVASINPVQVGRAFSDVILFSIEPKEDGSLNERNSQEAFAVLPSLRAAGVKRLLVAVGGWERSSAFPAVAADPERRKRFAEELLRFVNRHGLSGIDLDWEPTEGGAPEADYSALVLEVGKAPHSQGRMLTVAVGDLQTFTKEALRVLDRIHLMAYDAPGEHSTMKVAESAVKRLLALGAKPSQLALGMPFYGRHVSSREAKTYSELVSEFSPSKSQNLVGGFYINGPDMILAKVRYAKTKKLRGVMAWEIGQDSPDQKFSLAEVIRKAR